MIKAVLFDLDGTLVNSLDDLADSVNYSLSKFGLPEHKTEEFKYFAGNGIAKMVERAIPADLRGTSVYKKVLDVFFKYYSVHFADNTKPYGGLKELVCDLKQMGIKIAVVTNKAQQIAENVVKTAYGDIFDIICGKQENAPLKPDPYGAISVMRELGVSNSECIFLGDSSIDMETGINCGALPVGVLWGYRTADELLKSGAKYIIGNPEELLGIISEIK